MTTPTIRTKVFIIIQGIYHDGEEILEVYLNKNKAILRVNQLIQIEHNPHEYSQAVDSNDPNYLCWKTPYSQFFEIKELIIQDYTGDLINPTVSDLVNRDPSDLN